LFSYINYPYNYLEPSWHFSPLEEQQGYVNLNPPRTHLTAQDIQSNIADNFDEIQLPPGIPQEVISQDHYELISRSKMVYENFVPFIATRRVVCRQQRLERQVDEMTYKI
jgi:ribosome-associated toxin RatA of RatAB toxin-antitoxin module